MLFRSDLPITVVGLALQHFLAEAVKGVLLVFVVAVIISPIEAHSKKPDEARVKIISLMGDLPRVELFARQTPPGWAVWGNEVTPTIPDFGTHCPEVQKGV